MAMQTYVVIKELPDARVGTKVSWDENEELYCYNKSAYCAPHDKSYLTKGQVIGMDEYFKPYKPYDDFLALKASFTPEQKALFDLFVTGRIIGFSLEDMMRCFVNSRLSHNAIRWEYDTFKDYMKAEFGMDV